MAGEDRPITVGGAGHHITIEVPDYSAGNQPKTLSITPKDPQDPFREIVITDGTNEVMRWPLSADWKITIA